MRLNVLKLMSLISLLFLCLVVSPSLRADDDAVILRGDGADADPALRNLRTENAETAAPEPVEVPAARSGVPPEESGTDLGGTPLTEPVVETRTEPEPPTEPDAAVVSQNLAECNNLGSDEAKCECNANFLRSHQENLLKFKAEGTNKKSMAELLKKKDDITSKMAVLRSLLDVWENYQNFLKDNSELTRNNELTAPQSAQQAVNNLNQLKDFISQNEQPVQRYHLTSEVLSILGDREQLKTLSSNEAKVDYLKARISERCGRPDSQALYMCQNGAYQSIQYQQGWDQPTSTAPDNLNRLVNAVVSLDGWEVSSLSSLFVDNDDVNITGMDAVSDGMVGVIDEAIKACREEVLLGNDDNVECFSRDIDSLVSGQPALRQKVDRLRNGLKATANQNWGIRTVGDLSTAYMAVAQATKNAHEDSKGGTFDSMMQMMSRLGNPARDLDSAGREISSQTNSLRNEFKELTKGKLIGLGHHLGRLKLKEKQEMFNRYLGGNGANLFSDGGFDFRNKNSAQAINEMITSVMCEGLSSGSTCESIPFFKMVNGEAELDASNFAEHFSGLIENTRDVERLKEMLLPGREGSLKDELDRVNTQIAEVRQNNQYQNMSAFKDYLYDRTKNYCVRSNQPQNQEIRGVGCQVIDGVTVGIDDFLKIGDDLIAFKNRDQVRENLRDLNERCLALRESNFEVYQRDFLSTGICSTIQQEQLDVQRVRTETAARASNPRIRAFNDHDVIKRWENGRVVAMEERKSWLELSLVPGARVFAGSLPFITNHALFSNQVDMYRNMGYAERTQRAYQDAFAQNVNTFADYCSSSGNIFNMGPCVNNSLFNFYYGPQNGILGSSAPITPGQTGFNF